MTKPLIVINAKTYPQTTGDGAVFLVRACDEVIEETGANIGLAVQEVDLRMVQDAAKQVTVYAQHVDPGTPGKNTGFQLAQTVHDMDVTHTILNHSEHKVSFAVLQETVKQCKALNMTIILCADTVQEITKLTSLKPDYIAFEPPELIGGDISVTSAEPDIIKKAVNASMGIPVLVGAGVKNGKDVSTALSLGAKGVLVASGVDLATDVRAVLRDLVIGSPK